jgi:hypothetical protein
MTVIGWDISFEGSGHFPGMFLASRMMTGVGRGKRCIARDPDLSGMHVVRQATT